MRLGAVLILLTCLLPWIPINPPVSLSLSVSYPHLYVPFQVWCPIWFHSIPHTLWIPCGSWPFEVLDASPGENVSLSKVSNHALLIWYETWRNHNKMTWKNNICCLLMCIEYLLIMPLPCGWGSLLMSLPFPVDLIIEILHALPAVSTWKLQCFQLRYESVQKRGMLQIMAIKNGVFTMINQRIWGFHKLSYLWSWFLQGWEKWSSPPPRTLRSWNLSLGSCATKISTNDTTNKDNPS